MKKVTSSSGMNRLYLISFIFLCSVFTSENAFSYRFWEKEDMEITYEQSDGFITFKFLFYDHYVTTSYVVSQGFLSGALIKYSEDDNKYIDLVGTETQKQDLNDVMWMKINKYKGDKIEFPNSIKPENTQLQPDLVGAKMMDSQRNANGVWKKCKAAYMSIKWHLPESSKSIKSVKLSGTWHIYQNKKFIKGYRIEAVYPIVIVRSKSSTMKNNLSVWESEICDKVRVTKNGFAINVTGAKPGEEIKVYNIAGVELKSVVATDDVVNIKLAKNQMYIVKTEQARYKVLL